MRIATLLALVASLSFLGCEDGAAELVVQLRTARVPAAEVAAAGAGTGGGGDRACWSSNGRPGKVIIVY